MKSVEISADEFEKTLYAVGYKLDVLFKVYKADRIVVNGDVDLSGTPITHLVGNFIFRGRLNLAHSSVVKINILKADKYINTFDTPYQDRKDRIRVSLLRRRIKSERALDTPMIQGFFDVLILDENIYGIRDALDIEDIRDAEYTMLYDEITGYYEDDTGCVSIEIDGSDFILGSYEDMKKYGIDRVLDLLQDAYTESDLKQYVIDKNPRFIDGERLLSDIKSYIDDDKDYYLEMARDNVEREDDMSDIEYDDMVDEEAETLMAASVEQAELMVSNRDFSDIEDLFPAFGIKEYFDFDRYAKYVVGNDGFGHTIGSYDNEEHEYYYDGEVYYAIRLN